MSKRNSAKCFSYTTVGSDAVEEGDDDQGLKKYAHTHTHTHIHARIRNDERMPQTFIHAYEDINILFSACYVVN